MHTRRVTRFHPARSAERNPSWWQHLQGRSGAVLLTLAITAIGAVLVWMPVVWVGLLIQRINNKLLHLYSGEITRVEEHWLNLPRINDLNQGDEPKILQILDEQPLLVAVLDRSAPGRLWLRRGDRLVSDDQEPERSRYLQWIAQAAGSRRSQWTPPLPQTGDPNTGPAILLLGERWIVIKQWSIGSPQVEKTLRLVFGSAPKFRAGLRRTADQGNANAKPQEWGAEPNLQVDPARLEDPLFAYQGMSQALDGWDLVGIPKNQESRVLLKQVFHEAWAVFAAALGVAASLGMGLWLRRRAQQRAILDSDRLASFTHSLKTPLAILKFRCDSIRLGRLSSDQADAALIKVGEEVDNLTLMIETGLEAIQGISEAGPQGEVSAAWLSEVAKDLMPAFEAEGRILHLEFTSDSGRAARASLRTAILTLLENALYHGKGEVTLQTTKIRHRLQIRVKNTGSGLETHQVEALGKPYLRLRNMGKEGFEREGQGLGLSLLVQVARKEGWGLTFSSAPSEGFLATLEIQPL